MSARTRFVLCATDSDGRIYFSASPDGYAWPQPTTPLFGGMTTTRTPILFNCNVQLHMLLTGPDGQILHSLYDPEFSTWSTPDPKPLAGYSVYSNGGHVPPAVLVEGEGFWLFFVDGDKHLQACFYDGQHWSAVTPVQFPPGQTEDIPAFVQGPNMLLMCAADTDGHVALYAPTNPEGDPTSWEAVSSSNIIDGISTFNNRTPLLILQDDNLTMLALDSDGVVQQASWPVGQIYANAKGQPLFAGDNWKCQFAPVAYREQAQLCLCDNRGRLYFALPSGAGWVHPDDPYSWWLGWETWGGATPSVCHFDLDGPSHPGYAWMADIDGDTPLSQISIPGTHDSLTYTVSNNNPASQCQTMSFLEQLQCGVRYFDFRPGVSKDQDGNPDFEFFHGSTSLGLTFKQLYPVLLNFLAAFPTETVILCLNDHNNGSDPKGFMATLDYFTGQHLGAWHLTDIMPNLTDVRGKIVLYRRFKVPDGNERGVNLTTGWDNNSPYDTIQGGDGTNYYIQDDYAWPPSEWSTKVDKITAMLDDSVAQTMGPGCYMTFTNAASGGTPVWFSAQINPKVMDKLASLGRPRQIGLLAMDYIEEPFAHSIFLKNFSTEA